MSNNQQNPLANLLNNTTVLGLGGLVLFFLGLLAAMMGMSMKDGVPEKTNMALATAVMLSMGYPLLLYVQSLKRIADLERRIAEIETRGKD